MRLMAAALLCLLLYGCSGGGGDSTSNASSTGCTESGVDASFACKTGSTEPLYSYQWALKHARSFFAAFTDVSDGSTDLNVEEVHALGIKGQGVKVLVLDDGLDIRNEDLAPNVQANMTHNFDDGTSDPTPPDTPVSMQAAHGTAAAGIIAAAQNGRGLIGVAPRVALGGARFMFGDGRSGDAAQAYGGAEWSKMADIINASYGDNPAAPTEYDTATSAQPWIRAFPLLRGGKGLVMLKAGGNEYMEIGNGSSARRCPLLGGQAGLISCENPANDVESLEPGVVNVAAANAKGTRSSYSSAGSVIWITGLGGEQGDGGAYGEVGAGPVIFSTDLTGCRRGYSREGVTDTSAFNLPATPANAKDNSRCDYATMNGTSAAAPGLSGVVALMLSANPALTWRDVREILRATARKIDPSYGSRDKRNMQIDLLRGQLTANTSAALVDGATTARLDFGWQKNGAGYEYSTWYGFGLADAAAAVQMAKTYTAYRPAQLDVPVFARAFADVTQFNYGSVQKLGQISVTSNDDVDAFQLRLTGSLCIGSVGIFVKSPSGTVSTLSLPYNGYYSNDVASVSSYGLSSYAFFGEKAAGNWEVFAVSGVPQPGCASFTGATSVALKTPLNVEYRILARR